MRESEPPASDCRNSARRRRRADEAPAGARSWAAAVVVLRCWRPRRRDRRRRRRRTRHGQRRARSAVAPAGPAARTASPSRWARPTPRPRSRSGRTSAARPAGSSRTASGRPIHELEDAGRLKVEYHLATIIDGNLGGSGSLQRGQRRRRARRTPGSSPRTTTCSTRTSRRRPTTRSAKNSRLIELAGKVEGLDTPAFRKCVEDGTHNSWVEKSNDGLRERRLPRHPDRPAQRQGHLEDKGDETDRPRRT